MSGMLFLDRLSAADLALLSAAAGEGGSSGSRIAALREDPRRIERLMQDPRVYEALFRGARDETVVVTAPFLAFGVLMARTHRVLDQVAFVPERVGHRRRVPVFDVASLRDFLADPFRRFFLVELLASYAHVASGSVLVRTERGWRRRRFSELDPLTFAELIGTVPEDQRLPLYRRLGDLSLFLTGVFPDYAARRLVGPLGLDRLQRAVEAAGSGGTVGEGDPPDGWDPAIGLLESLGRRSYRRAWEATEPRDVGVARVVGEVSERFGDARRVLNFLAERDLFPLRHRWFRSEG